MAEIEVTDAGSSRIEQCFLGFGAIEEGIAWAIEQATGTSLQAIDAPPPLPAFPYTILAAVIERVAPGLSSEIGTKLALLALNTHQPWRSLLAWLLRVHAASDKPAELDAIVREWRSDWSLLLQVVRQELNDLATAYARRGLAELGMRSTLNVCQRLFQWRTQDPFLELAFTSGTRPWPELFARGPACELLVERDAPDENDLLASLRTLGGGNVRNTDDDVASRRVLHAQEHFCACTSNRAASVIRPLQNVRRLRTRGVRTTTRATFRFVTRTFVGPHHGAKPRSTHLCAGTATQCSRSSAYSRAGSGCCQTRRSWLSRAACCAVRHYGWSATHTAVAEKNSRAALPADAAPRRAAKESL